MDSEQRASGYVAKQLQLPSLLRRWVHGLAKEEGVVRQWFQSYNYEEIDAPLISIC